MEGDKVKLVWREYSGGKLLESMVSASGLTIITRSLGPRCYMVAQHDIVKSFLTDQDREMKRDPEGYWERNEAV